MTGEGTQMLDPILFRWISDNLIPLQRLMDKYDTITGSFRLPSGKVSKIYTIMGEWQVIYLKYIS